MVVRMYQVESGWNAPMAGLNLSPNVSDSGELITALSADIRLLAGMLGMVIREQHDEDAFQLVEKVRALANTRRRDEKQSAAMMRALTELIEGADLASLRILIKAFANYFQLINIAEDQQRIRVLRQREMNAALDESLESAIRDLHESGVDAAGMRAILDRVRVRLVLTAHPSEAKRKEVLHKLRHIAQLLAARDRAGILDREQRAIDASLMEEIEELWQTRPTRAVRATIMDEVDFGVYFLTSVIMDVALDLYDELRFLLERHYPGEDWSDLPP
ncbi:MAG: phosphoenolpyruvate carboxylase, partial [Anaerolineae bacterium]|nr:phosphoenolpyruvate carboxylase [Anaerolineae bacterium]